MGGDNPSQSSFARDAGARISAAIAQADGDKWILDRLGRLAAVGEGLGGSQEQVADAMDAYMASPADWNFGLQEKKLLIEVWDLPEEALNTPLNTGALIDFAGGLQGTDKFEEVLRDPETWKKIKRRGRGGRRETEQILTEVFAEEFGVPRDTAFRLTFEQLMKGVAELQKSGMESAVKNPDFWDDYTGSMSDLALYEKWREIVDREEAEESARLGRQLKQKIKEFNQACAERDKRLAELRKLREEDRRKRIIEERRRKRKKRKRGIVTTIPEEFTVTTYREVSTPWGDNFLLAIHGDGSTQLIRIEPDGRHVVAREWDSAYMLSETPSGKMHVVPVIGSRVGQRATGPLDGPSDHSRGPVGM